MGVGTLAALVFDRDDLLDLFPERPRQTLEGALASCPERRPALARPRLPGPSLSRSLARPGGGYPSSPGSRPSSPFWACANGRTKYPMADVNVVSGGYSLSLGTRKTKL